MKKHLLGLATLSLVLLSTGAHAGKVKDILIDTDEAITQEFSDAGLKVISITGHDLISTKNGVGVNADVETSNPTSKISQYWSCLVSFEKVKDTYVAQDVNCN